LRRLTIFDLDESDLGADAVAVARSMGLSPEPDPEPKRNVFIRGDQYDFIRKGTPSLMFKVGFARGTAEEETFNAWPRDRYHAPSDDLDQPVDKAAGGAFDLYMARLLERVADRDAPPMERLVVLQAVCVVRDVPDPIGADGAIAALVRGPNRMTRPASRRGVVALGHKPPFSILGNPPHSRRRSEPDGRTDAEYAAVRPEPGRPPLHAGRPGGESRPLDGSKINCRSFSVTTRMPPDSVWL
jgi:hypothetical protein